MSGKVRCALLVAVLVSAVSSRPQSPAVGNIRDTNVLRKLSGQETPGQEAASPARAVRRAHLSEDERELMTKQIMQAISEMMNSECMLDRDYQGWVDFGRRDAE